MPSGVHTVGVEVSAEGEDPVIAESSVTVVRPADAEFLESLSIDNARVDIHDGEIHITEAEATPAGGTSVTTELTLSYHVSRQGFGIDMAQDDLGPMQSPYDALELLESVGHAIFDTYDALNDGDDRPGCVHHGQNGGHEHPARGGPYLCRNERRKPDGGCWAAGRCPSRLAERAGPLGAERSVSVRAGER